METFPMLILTFICFISLNGVPSGAVLPDLRGYNPLGVGYTVQNEWKHYSSPRTPVVASAVDFKNGADCQRIIVFSAQAVVFGHHSTSCDRFDPRLGLVEAFGALWYFKQILVGQESDGKYAVLFNKPDRTCIKKTYTITSGSVKRTRSRPEHIPESDPECQDLINKKIPGGPVTESQLVDLHKKLAAGSVNDISTFDNGLSIQGKSRMPSWDDRNLNQDFGVIFFKYIPCGYDDCHDINQVIVTAKGVPLAAVLEKDQPRNIVATKDHIYCDKDIMVKRGEYENSFIVITRLNEDTCSEQTFTLKSLNGRLEKEEKSSENISKENQKCKDLIEGNKFKNQKANNYVSATNEAELITFLEKDINSDDPDPENEDL